MQRCGVCLTRPVLLRRFASSSAPNSAPKQTDLNGPLPPLSSIPPLGASIPNPTRIATQAPTGDFPLSDVNFFIFSFIIIHFLFLFYLELLCLNYCYLMD